MIFIDLAIGLISSECCHVISQLWGSISALWYNTINSLFTPCFYDLSDGCLILKFLLWQLTVFTVYVFLYGRMYLVLSGLEKGLIAHPAMRDNKPLQVALASQSFVQIGFLMALPMMMEIGLERGF